MRRTTPPDVVETVFVGNEVVLRGDLTPQQLAARLDLVKRQVEVPVGTAEPWHVWLEHPELLRAVDVVVVHVHPYWDGVAVEDAAAHTLAKLDEVRELADPQPMVLGEFGWPTAGEPPGNAVPRVSGMRHDLHDLLPKLDRREQPYFGFEMWDEAWKERDEGPIGPHWGQFEADGSTKFPAPAPALAALRDGASERSPRATEPLEAPPAVPGPLREVLDELIPLVEAETTLRLRRRCGCA